MTTRARALIAPLALAGVLAGAVPAPAPAQLATVGTRALVLDTSYVEAVIQIHIVNGPQAVIPALVGGTTLLLPLRQYTQLVEIHLDTLVLGDSATLRVQPANERIVFRPSEQLLSRGGVPMTYDTADVVWWDGDLFVATEVLDRVLGTRTTVEWRDLSATIGNTGGLPLIARERRERRRQILGISRPAPNVLDLALHERVVDGAVVSWSLTSASRRSSDLYDLQLGFGAGLLGGSVEVRPQVWTSGGVSGSELRASWSRVFHDSRYVRQVGVGDVYSSGRRARPLTGFVATNAPFIRASEFDVEQYVGAVPAGWEVELYENGRLLAFADADALGTFRVPLELRYGQNPFELVLYGPGGETVRQRRTVRVPFSRIQAGRLEYAAALGRCRTECDGLFSGDVRYGLSSRVTVQGGFDVLALGGYPPVWQPYAVVSGAPLTVLGLTGEAVANGHLRASAELDPSPDLRASGTLTRFSEAGADPRLGLVERTRAEGSMFWRPGLLRGDLYFNATLVQSAGLYRRSLQRISANTRFGPMRYGLGILHDATRRTGSPTISQFAIDLSSDIWLNGPYRWLRQSNLATQMAFDPSRGFTALRAAAGRRVSQAIRLDVALGWFRGQGMSLELAFNSAGRGPRFGARTRVSDGTGAEVLSYTQGAVAWDPRSRLLRLGEGSDLGRAGIHGLVFRDDNNNGLREPGEPGLAGIPIQVGGWPATTDSSGRFAAFGLMPYLPAQIEVDSLSFDDPRFILPAQILRVRPAANAFGSVIVPVTIGGEVSGFVVHEGRALAGVPVLLREMNTGIEIRILTFADGGFYKAAVPPGEYEVTMPDDVLERLNALAPPLSIFVPPGTAEKRYDDLQLRLVPRT